MTVRNPFPSIPAPNQTIAGLYATVAALQQAVALLVSNAQNSQTQQTLATNSNIFAQASQVAQQINKTGVLSTQTVSLGGEVATLKTEVTSIGNEVTTLTGEVNSFNGANIQAGTVQSAALAPGTVSVRAQDIESGSTTATANITLGVAGDVLVLVAYLGTNSGAGAILAVTVDGGSPQNIIQTPAVGGDALPGVGFLLVQGLTAGAHTFVATASVSGVNVIDVQIAVIGLMR